MQAANKSRTPTTLDEIWLLEHPPVFTLGLAGKPEHVLTPGKIEVIKIDRGGQVTYHGPGQLVIYLMLDLGRMGFGVKELVKRIEQSVIDLLAEYGIESYRKHGMPGVYVKSPSPSVPPPRRGREENLAPPPSRGRDRGRGVFHVNPRHATFPKTLNPIFCKQIDHRLLDPFHKCFDTESQAFEIEQQVGNELSGPVIRHLPAAINFDDRDVTRRE